MNFFEHDDFVDDLAEKRHSHQLTHNHMTTKLGIMDKTTRPAANKSTKKKVEEQDAPPDSLTTAIHLQRPTWQLLRDVAFHRAKNGGRVSVSKLINDLVEANRGKLEKEMQT